MIYTFRIVKCQKCGEELLVERTLIGTDHTADILVSHKKCLKTSKLPRSFIEEYPDEAKHIREWLDK